MQNNCWQFSLRLDKMHHISLKEFITAVFFNLNGILEFARQYRIDTRNSFARSNHLFDKTNTEQKTLSYIGASLSNNMPESVKKTNNF